MASGFLKEVLHGGGNQAQQQGNVGHRLSARNSQAVKVILSESYIRWCSEPDTHRLLDTLCREMLAASKTSHPATPAPSQVAASGRSSSNIESSRHSDPGTAAVNEAAESNVQRSTSPSPPPSPPMRQRNRKEEERRTPSPVQHHTRFLGVDELDAHHRTNNASPGGASPVSPTSMHNHQQQHGAQTFTQTPPNLPTSQPHNTTSSLLETTTFFDPSGSPSGARGTSPTEHAQHKYVSAAASGTGTTYAPLPIRTVPVASIHDVPVFYHKTDPEGCARELNIEELDILASAFASAKSATRPSTGGRGGRVGAAAVDIDVNKTVRKLQFGKITKEVFGLPIWLKDCLYRRIAAANGLSESQPLNYHFIKKFYDTAFGRLTPNRRLFELIRQNPRGTVLTLDDLRLAVRYLVDTHVGLEFLRQPEFQESYCKTVAIRIVFELEQRHQRNVAWPQFDRSDLPGVMRDLDDTPDINQVLRYFSYEHFYVLYCRFWELDSDRDLFISLQDLQQYGVSALTTSILQRVASGAARKLTSGVPGKLDFEDFVYFCLSEEDKNHPQSIYYWFRALDVDCDGILSGFELGKFFEENKIRFAELAGDDSLKLEDMLCQMLDMVGANRIKEHAQGLTLSDLRACDSAGHFFDMIFNANKFMNFEHRDPFAEHQQKLQPEKTDWDRFARLEYDRMATEVS